MKCFTGEAGCCSNIFDVNCCLLCSKWSYSSLHKLTLLETSVILNLLSSEDHCSLVAAFWTSGTPHTARALLPWPPLHPCSAGREFFLDGCSFNGVVVFLPSLEKRVPRTVVCDVCSAWLWGCTDESTLGSASVQTQTYRQREVQKDFHFPKPLCFVCSSLQPLIRGKGACCIVSASLALESTQSRNVCPCCCYI